MRSPTDSARLPFKNKKMGVLISGGLDSSTLVGFLLERGFDVFPIYIRCGLRWEQAELYWIKKYFNQISFSHLKPLVSLRLSLEDAYKGNWSQTGLVPSLDSDDRSVFLPARNLLLITKALLYLSSLNIYQLALATLKGNPFPDGKKSYFTLLAKVLSFSFNKQIRIFSPFRNSSKTEIIRMNSHFPLHLSFSCINPQGLKHCGVCNKCGERKRAFRKAKYLDATSYYNS